MSNGATLSGEARFTPPGDGRLHYREDGTLVLADGQRFRAFRTYVYAPMAGGFAVWFDETPVRLFHEIALRADGGAWIGEADHPCRDDLYRSRYVFRGNDSFEVSHVVSGPRTGYAMTTGFERDAVGSL